MTYSISGRMKSRLAVAALESAVTRRDLVAGCVVHSDADRSRKFVRARARARARDRHGLVGSMGRAGAADDNRA
ncbi:hypothetical protein FXW78_24940 [Rhodococcus opacus]|nr:hypothetical protein [Rhodococcus opacus]